MPRDPWGSENRKVRGLRELCTWRGDGQGWGHSPRAGYPLFITPGATVLEGLSNSSLETRTTSFVRFSRAEEEDHTHFWFTFPGARICAVSKSEVLCAIRATCGNAYFGVFQRSVEAPGN